MDKKTSWWTLFLAFFRIGLFTFGGGFAMFPLIEKEIVNNYGWAEKEELLDIFALAQSVPGAIGVNTAVFIGTRLYGMPGALVALLGVITPSILIILIIAQFFLEFQTNPYLAKAFAGVRAAVVGLIAAATVRVGKNAITDRFALALALGALALSSLKVIPVIWIIFLGGLSGYFYYTKRGFGRK